MDRSRKYFQSSALIIYRFTSRKSSATSADTKHSLKSCFFLSPSRKARVSRGRLNLVRNVASKCGSNTSEQKPHKQYLKKIKDLKKANIEIKWSTLKLLGHGKTTSKVTQTLLCSHTVIFNGVYVQTAPKISPVLLLGQDFFN